MPFFTRFVSSLRFFFKSSSEISSHRGSPWQMNPKYSGSHHPFTFQSMSPNYSKCKSSGIIFWGHLQQLKPELMWCGKWEKHKMLSHKYSSGTDESSDWKADMILLRLKLMPGSCANVSSNQIWNRIWNNLRVSRTNWLEDASAFKWI